MRTIMHSRSMNHSPESAYRVKFGLRYCTPNPLPYFSVTVTAPASLHVSVGCAHDDVLKRHPDMADIVALHLSDTTGAPNHALENAWYWWSDADGKGTHLNQYRDTGRTNLDVFANHLRIDRAEVDALDLPTFRTMGGDYALPAEFVAFVDAQRERWQREADEAIAKYGLHGWND